MNKIEKLLNKWHNFEDGTYTELFNYEALYIDHIDEDYNMIAINNNYYFDDIIKEAQIDEKSAMIQLIQDVESVGIEYIAMLGCTMTTEQWLQHYQEKY